MRSTVSTKARVVVAIGCVVVVGWWVFNFGSLLPLQNGFYQCHATDPLRDGTPTITGAVIKDDAIYTFTGQPGAVGGPGWNPEALPLAKEGNRRFSAGFAVGGDGRYVRYSCEYAGVLHDSEDGSIVGQ